MTSWDKGTNTPAARLNEISIQGLCIGCGLCQGLGAPGEITVEATPEGSLRPIPGESLSQETVDRVYRLCPGTQLDSLPQNLTQGAETDLIWGPVRSVLQGYAGDPDIRFKAATGGVLTGLAVHLLESGQVSFVLHATADTKRPSFGRHQISRTREDVIAGAGSRYGPTATLIEIMDAFALDQPFAFIGTPCDVSALRNLAKEDLRVDQLCRIMMAPICGGFMETHALKKAVENHDIAFDRLTSVRYRGYGCPGPTRMEQDDGKTAEATYLDFWGEDDSAWSLPWRCKICFDGIGEAADLVATDNWPGGAPTQEQASDHTLDPGSNGIIIRSQRAADLIDSALASGALIHEGEKSVADLSLWQPHQVRRRQAVPGRFAALAEVGRLVPETGRLRLHEIAAANPDPINTSQKEGTLRRIGVGKATERPPRPAPQD